MQSVYFCNMLDIGLDIYIPDANSFMMYFDKEAVQVDLDRSYLADPIRKPLGSGPGRLPPKVESNRSF
jgi:hypothetical protein